MCEIVEQAEEYGEGFLNTEEPVEGPLAVELDNGLDVVWFALLARVCDNVLTRVIAF